LVEQLIRNQQVSGSSPLVGFKINSLTGMSGLDRALVQVFVPQNDLAGAEFLSCSPPSDLSHLYPAI
jgi:hypothetical protein